MKRLWIIVGLVGAGLVLAPLVVPIFVSWSPINCRDEEINIKTGQARYRRSLWFVCVSERIEDTPLSLALQGETVDAADVEPWHTVNTFSPGVHHSPHYRFHAALFQARQVELICTMLDSSPEQKRQIATRVLTLWQQSGDYGAAGKYISGLMDRGISDKGTGRKAP